MADGQKPIYILNGPNLNRLGEREPAVYGKTRLADIRERCQAKADSLGLAIEFRQTNTEGELVDWVQEASSGARGLILNAAAYTHTSIAILDAVRACECRVIEVHLSNIYARESYRRVSVIAEAADGSICGLGVPGYLLAMDALTSDEAVS